MGHLQPLKEVVLLLAVVMGVMNRSFGAVPHGSMRMVDGVNKEGPFLGIVVPNSFEMNPLLQTPSFVPNGTLPHLDISGRRFRIGRLQNEKVIIVMTGLSMLNAGITTELLLTLFNVKGVVHYGIAGNANPDLQIGDVTIPRYWAHTGLWNWQRFGDGPGTELAFESDGDYTRKIGYLNISGFNNHTSGGEVDPNLLNNVWYQPEEIFAVDGVPEVRQHAFRVPINRHYFAVSKKIKGLKLGQCVNSTCLPRAPMVVRVERGVSANVLVDNSAYRQFLYSKFNATAIDMESASIARVCRQHKMPFIAIRSLSDLAGGGSSLSNEASIFASLAVQNAVDVLLRFIALLFSS
ncbi:bark storage protein A-like [Rhodamnia argentea]|uniref:Bark storage protein A-like n=1 Tax=Rhodamnia argentea TaxID=178133 RepID=A0A8B8Q5E3_9MYRT|nr:bark storage protein A-like [Rhodamnia argentea]